MLLKRGPAVEGFAQLLLAQRRVYLSVANSVYQLLGLSTATFGQQMVLVNAGAHLHRSAAQRAVW